MGEDPIIKYIMHMNTIMKQIIILKMHLMKAMTQLVNEETNEMVTVQRQEWRNENKRKNDGMWLLKSVQPVTRKSNTAFQGSSLPEKKKNNHLYLNLLKLVNWWRIAEHLGSSQWQILWRAKPQPWEPVPLEWLNATLLKLWYWTVCWLSNAVINQHDQGNL